MTTLTLISDLGAQNHDLARFRNRLKKEMKGVDLEIINAECDRHDLVEAAYILDAVLPDFERDTIHIVDVDTDMHSLGPALMARVNDQWVISANNGFLSLISHTPEHIFHDTEGWSAQGGTFTLLHTFLPLAQRLYTKGSAGLKPAKEIREKAGIAPVISENTLRGTVIYVDKFGNAITNITRDELERVAAGRKMNIRLNRHTGMDKVLSHYGEVQVGMAVCVWTSQGNLQVSLYHGDASRLLGLEKGKMITVDFE